MTTKHDKEVTQLALPDKLSDVILVALADFEECERMPEVYEIDMGIYHRWTSKRKCTVCFAGATMARTLRTSIYDAAIPDSFHPHDRDRLYALNNVRYGFVHIALLGIDIGERNLLGLPESIPVAAYPDPQFKTDMRKLAAMLAEKGL